MYVDHKYYVAFAVSFLHVLVSSMTTSNSGKYRLQLGSTLIAVCFLPSFIPSFIHSFIHLFIHSFVRPSVHPSIHSLLHSLTSFIHLFIHSLFRWRSSVNTEINNGYCKYVVFFSQFPLFDSDLILQ